MYEKTIENIATIEHQQWMHWSQAVALDFETIKNKLLHEETDEAIHFINQKLKDWKRKWIPYDELDENTKEYNRTWANKVLKLM